ncbi:hypothetical protein BsWGS_21138 [Bradybaena similaris]
MLTNLCVYMTSCSCCDCWSKATAETAPQRPHIQHPCMEQHQGRPDSPSSTADSIKSYRERMDSEMCRADSVSSASGGSTDSRRHLTPVIDMRTVEFWTANRETVQPRRKRASDSEIQVDNLQKELYQAAAQQAVSLTDEQKLEQFQLGQVHFGLRYDLESKVLVVKIIEARDIPLPYCLDETKQDMAHSNPYCKICLLPDQKDSKQTTVQRKTQEPAWNEYFSFHIDYQESQERTMEILLKDFDKFSRHRLIGRVLLPLCSVNLTKGGHMWKPLLPGNTGWQDLGELLLSINYLPSAGRLTLDVIKAKGLLQTDLVGGSDPFVRVTLVLLEKPVKTKKTSYKQCTIDPVFNESVCFSLTQEQMQVASVVVTVMDHNSKSRDGFVGRIVIGYHGTGTQESQHWGRMLQSQRSPVAQWHSLKSRDNCDQVSVASIAVP